jgi:hypothetical protein
VSDMLGLVVRIARSGRKHRVGKRHILSAMVDAGLPDVVGDTLHYLGTDDRGLELEIVAVPDNSGRADLTVIHAMPTGFRRGAHDRST